MIKWKRPELCRLCKCPVGREGVPVSQLDKTKLICWWPKMLQIEWDDDEESDEKHVCQFCFWDAKFYGDADNDGECDWWTGHRSNKFFYRYYYYEQVIQPCAVMIHPMSNKSLLKQEDGLSDQRAETDEQIANKESGPLRKSRNGIPTDCIFCKKTFKSRSSVLEHIKEVHKEYKDLKCKRCLLHFATLKEKIDHFQLTHRKLRTCHLCFKSYAPDALVSHVSKLHGCSNFWRCCNDRFENIDMLVRHMCSKLLRKKYECIYCKLKFPSLRNHMQQQHKAVAISCHYMGCSKHFLSHKEKQKHVEEVHESKSNLIECIYCNCKMNRIILRRHMMQWHKSTSIRCDFNLCLLYFHTEEEKQQHLMLVHFLTKVKPKVLCVYCGSTCSTKTNLHSHVKRCHRDIAIRCKINACSEYFQTECDLQSHFLVKHAARDVDRKWQCSQCSYRAFTRSHLVRHIGNHHGTEKLKCPQCSKIYKSQESLHAHIYIAHTKETFCVLCKSTITGCMHFHLIVRPCRFCKIVKPCVGQSRAHRKVCQKRPELKNAD